MRDALLIVGSFLLFVLVAAPWVSIFDWLRKERGKKYKSHNDVI
jgi:hypothetical protein